jgi:hypothetical protein
MARVKNSPLEGLRGTLGDMVFRTWGGKTFVHPKPQKPRRQTAAQKATRIRFSQASMRAQEMLVNHDMRNHYEQEALRLNLPNAYTTALRDQIIGDANIPPWITAPIAAVEPSALYPPVNESLQLHMEASLQ